MIKKITDWYTSNKKSADFLVLFVTILLGSIGFGSMGLVTYLHFKMNGDLVYFAIYFVAIAILFIALIPAYKMHTVGRKILREDEAERIMKKLKGIDPFATDCPGPK